MKKEKIIQIIKFAPILEVVDRLNQELGTKKHKGANVSFVSSSKDCIFFQYRLPQWVGFVPEEDRRRVLSLYDISDMALTHIEENYDEPLARLCNDFFDEKQANFETYAKSALDDIQDGLTVEEAVQNLVRDVIADVRALHDMTR